MQRSRPRSLLVRAAAPLVAIAAAVPLLATGAVAAAPAAGGSHRASLTSSLRGGGAVTRDVVLLRERGLAAAPRAEARAVAVRREAASFGTALRRAGVRGVRWGRSIPFVVADLTARQREVVARDAEVALVTPDVVIPQPVPFQAADAATPATLAPTHRAAHPTAGFAPPSVCGTAVSPESDPEAIGVIGATQANALGYDGAGVTVAYIADGVNPADPDFLRNPAYASAGSVAGSPVLTQQNFTGDPAGTPTGGGEAFLDSSSIAAQGNTVYDLSTFVNAAHPTPQTPCDIKITGAAPGASVLGLDVFSALHDTTESNFLQAIDYAVTSGAKVLNESFGSNNYPDTALDAARLADDDAVTAGVTVVVSSGDAGPTSTLGSPSTDPNLISVGASTTFRSYQQATYGGINATTPNASNGTWIDNNISSISSGGYSQDGRATVDLVAPGDLNWALCDANTALFTECTNDTTPAIGSSFQLTGGTSESAPLTSGAAADVIQAYATTHGGADPSPALVKQILMSTASDVAAPAEQQGAGLLDVVAAVKEAASIAGTSGTPQGGILVSPSSLNLHTTTGAAAAPQQVQVTNTGNASVTVDLSTRALTDQIASQTGSFCLNPSATTSSCGPPTATTFAIWSGVTEVYQEETFAVPSMTTPSRLDFSADYPSTGQTSLLHVALFDPSGSFAGYSIPQGLADFANIQVADPAAGTWTAVFFTEQNGATSGGVGTSGTIQWSATSTQFATAGGISPSSLTVAPGATRTATFTPAAPTTPGDTSQSIVLSTEGGPTTTVPVTQRALIALGADGGTFAGVLTGGNGRGNPAQTSTYQFQVPRGLHDLDVSATFGDHSDAVVAFLLDPEGEAVASSSSVTFNRAMTTVVTTGAVTTVKDGPQAGTWTYVLDWLQPVSGTELSEPFQGAVAFNHVQVKSNLPWRRRGLIRGRTYAFNVTIRNTTASPERYFLDPRTEHRVTLSLPDQNGTDQGMSLPLPPGVSFPLFSVPSDTTAIAASLTGSVPVTFDAEPFTGDPDLSPAVPAPGVTESSGGDVAQLRFNSSGEVMPGYWSLNPSEVGPYGASGAPSATASASFHVVTQGFDPTVVPASGDLWSAINGLTKTFTPRYLLPGHSLTIRLTIKPTAPIHSLVSGVINVDDVFQANELVGVSDSSADELARIPYSYFVT